MLSLLIFLQLKCIYIIIYNVQRTLASPQGKTGKEEAQPARPGNAACCIDCRERATLLITRPVNHARRYQPEYTWCICRCLGQLSTLAILIAPCQISCGGKRVPGCSLATWLRPLFNKGRRRPDARRLLSLWLTSGWPFLLLVHALIHMAIRRFDNGLPVIHYYRPSVIPCTYHTFACILSHSCGGGGDSRSRCSTRVPVRRRGPWLPSVRSRAGLFLVGDPTSLCVCVCVCKRGWWWLAARDQDLHT